MITKEAMEKVAAADAVDHANAIDLGFEIACRDMKLDDSRTAALAKVAMERIAEFQKTAQDYDWGAPGPRVTVTDRSQFDAIDAVDKADAPRRAAFDALPRAEQLRIQQTAPAAPKPVAPAPVPQPRVPATPAPVAPAPVAPKPVNPLRSAAQSLGMFSNPGAKALGMPQAPPSP